MYGPRNGMIWTGSPVIAKHCSLSPNMVTMWNETRTEGLLQSSAECLHQCFAFASTSITPTSHLHSTPLQPHLHYSSLHSIPPPPATTICWPLLHTWLCLLSTHAETLRQTHRTISLWSNLLPMYTTSHLCSHRRKHTNAAAMTTLTSRGKQLQTYNVQINFLSEQF